MNPSAAAGGALAGGFLLALVAWGAFAFGAVYSWAYWPLGVASVLFGLRPTFRLASERRLPLVVFPVLAIVIVGALQLVPLRLETIASWSPARLDAIRQLDPQAAMNVSTHHALSIDPRATAVAVILLAANLVLFIGCLAHFSLHGTRRFVNGLAIIGAGLALVGIVQHPLLHTGKIYGFWAPQGPGVVFGPFVNRNHFAGWMLMVLPLVIGQVCGRVPDSHDSSLPRTWRSRLLWFSSADANYLVLLGGATLAMSLALVMTMSRSGIVAFCLSIAITALFVMKVQKGVDRWTILSYLGVMTVLVVGWVGTDMVTSRFAATDWSDVNGRLGAWADSGNVISHFGVLGTGLNTYGTAMLLYQQHNLSQHFAQAHNDYLELAVEGGLVTLLLALAGIAAMLHAAFRNLIREVNPRTYWIRVGALTGLLAIGLQEVVDFSLQMPGNTAMFVVLCAIAVHGSRSHHQRDHGSAT